MALQDKPTWLNVDSVKTILRNFENDESIEIINATDSPATVLGDNYSCDVRRVHLEYSRFQNGCKILERKSFIAKIVPQSTWIEKLMSTGGHFETESSMMMEILPRMNQALETLGITPLSPHCFYVQAEKPAHLLLEDLSTKGFRMADRRKGLDLDKCLLTIRRIAEFHASSVALKEKDPMVITSYNKGMFCKDYPHWLQQPFVSSTKALAEEAAKWPELDPSISEKILNLSETAFAKAASAVECQDDDFNVLNHGDCWTNNFLFRYDEKGNPIESILVDFQLCVHGSPAIDLLYFFGISPSDEVRKNHRELLLRQYHDTLTITMAKLKCTTEVPSLEKLLLIIKKRAIFEAIVTFTLLPNALIERSKVKSLNELIEPKGKFENLGHQEVEYRKAMTRILPLYDSMGLFDV